MVVKWLKGRQAELKKATILSNYKLTSSYINNFKERDLEHQFNIGLQ